MSLRLGSAFGDVAAGIERARSPIVGSVIQTGSAAGPPLGALLNPTGSGKLLVLRKLKIEATANEVIKVRRTGSPVTPFQNILLALSAHLDERDTDSIVGVLRCGQHNAVAFGNADSQWVTTALNGEQRRLVKTYGEFPWTIAEGSALEVTLVTAGVGISLNLHAEWDEV